MAAVFISSLSAQPGVRVVDGSDMIRIGAAINAIQNPAPAALAASGAIAVTPAQMYVITDAGVAALTLAAPTAGTIANGGNDGVCITVVSTTAYAHTLTATGILNNGSASNNIATFAAHPGASIDLMAYNGQWYVLSSTAITFS